ncbi:MAG: phage terminase large subunit family protein [Lachnospiraceae bacterium]|nr:phage terminase large subunit family protein [Lachnospiraceae bacterium]
MSQWAEKYRILDESSNFSGRWSNDITPYLVGIMDTFNDPYIQEINFCKSTQVGGTEAMLNMLGWIIMENPSPTMIIYPSDDLAKDTSNDRIKPSLTKTPEIRERFYPNSSKELNLKFRGMKIYLRGSGSPGKLASKSIKYLFFDEIDKMDGASKKEASPYNLAKERTRTFTYSKKIYTCSTPTLKTNYVWQIHEEADEQRHYFVPCPHCGEYITFAFKQIKFPDGDGRTNYERAKESVYVCQECGCMISDKDKIRMLRRGQWRDVKKTCVGKPRKVSFLINALYSRFLSWSEIVMEFLDSKDDPEKLQNFVNSWLAEPWEDTKLKTSADLVMERQTNLGALVVPPWAKMLTAGVDVQENCLYWSIRSWGDFLTSQNIAHGQALSFADIERVMDLPYRKEDGTQYIVSLALIDSGDQTDTVYDFCALHSDWAFPVKGSSNPMQTHFKLSKINKAESRAYGMTLVLVDGGKYKDMIAARMKRPNGTGSWMVYHGCDREYAEQVTAEHKVNVKNGTKVRQEWVLKSSHADNHYLDTEVYAAAAADILGVRFLHLQEEPEEKPHQAPKEQNTPEENWIRQNESWL